MSTIQIINIRCEKYKYFKSEITVCPCKHKLTVKRKENVGHSQVAYLSFAIHYSGIHTRGN